MRGYKIVRADHTHNGFKYKRGLNIDPVTFATEGSCVPGGLYFLNSLAHLDGFLSYGVWLYEVEVPADAQCVPDPQGNKYRASKLILGKRRDLRRHSAWRWLVKQGFQPSNRTLYHCIKADNAGGVRWHLEQGIHFDSTDLEMAFEHPEVLAVMLEYKELHLYGSAELLLWAQERYLNIRTQHPAYPVLEAFLQNKNKFKIMLDISHRMI